ncbi:MAG TPA: hypothetical protein VHA33_28330 [Candidatus Angelobacter sp.]|jgi:hypothetical protein|nr:hypothetical protein [Candidatus Angelobacter sp.]
MSAQTTVFSSGSNGSDGALDFTGAPPGLIVFDPAKLNPPLNPRSDNIFNFTTITIPSGVTIRLSGRVLTGPVFWLASGDVRIDGGIDLTGENSTGTSLVLDHLTRAMPGAGGFSGGFGGKVDTTLVIGGQPAALPGDGPGGGAAGGTGFGSRFGGCFGNTGTGGSFTGNQFLVPLVGGSGGGGANFLGALPTTPYAEGGGAGGGAILIASSTSITINGVINANGGSAPRAGGQICDSDLSGGAGAGGAIRLAAPTISGSGTLTAREGGATVGPTGAQGGFIRLETFNDNFRGSFNSTAFTMASPFGVFLPSPHPSVKVVSVDNATIAQPPVGNIAFPDVSINNTGPVTVTIEAHFIPVGTVLSLHILSDNNTDQTVQTTPLAGTLETSTCTATVTFPGSFSLGFAKAVWSQ